MHNGKSPLRLVLNVEPETIPPRSNIGMLVPSGNISLSSPGILRLILPSIKPMSSGQSPGVVIINPAQANVLSPRRNYGIIPKNPSSTG